MSDNELACLSPCDRYVGRFIPRKERIMLMGDKQRKYNNVYIKNFGEELDDAKLRELFETYGKIISAKVVTVNLLFFRCVIILWLLISSLIISSSIIYKVSYSSVITSM